MMIMKKTKVNVEFETKDGKIVQVEATKITNDRHCRT